jgi:peptide/nickel transport system permease protein
MAVAGTPIDTVGLLEQREESPTLLVLRRFRRHKPAMISLAVLLLIILASFAAPIVAPYDPLDQNLANKNAPPSAQHWFGTDDLGRDILTRVLYAGRTSLYIALSATILAELLGIVIGVSAGYFGGWVDSLLMRIVDFMLTLPLLPILLVLSVVLNPSINLLIVILVLTGWMTGSRLVRGQVLSLRTQEYIAASRALGASDGRIMFKHLVPNSLAPVIVNASLNLSNYIVLEAALSFLGFGVKLPAPSWGNMLNGVDLTTLDRYPWQSFFPGAAIFLASLCANFIGDGLRDALDPRQKL